MKYLCIIQARCGSTRLPNKVLKDLNGKPMVMRVIERVQKSKYVDEVIMATSIEKANLPLIKVAAENGIRVFVGSENDVLDRFYQAAKLFQPEYVIRVTADCPLYDAGLLDDAIEQMNEKDDYLGDINSVMADGLDIEVFKFSALKEAYENAKLLSEREHVTIYIKNHPEKFTIKALKAKIEGIADLRLTVDEPDDFKLIEIIYKQFDSKLDFGIADVLDFLDKNKELLNINNKFIRNEGLLKSLKNDSEIN